jgi:short-subunit dehydrogenase
LLAVWLSSLTLVLVARRKDRLRKLADDLHCKHSISTRIAAADLSQAGFLPVIEQASGDLEIGLLVNNARIATTGNFLDNDVDLELTVLHVNNRAPVILSHHFGRLMRRRGRGGIIVISSTLAFAGVASMSNYAASKAHVLVFAEGLSRELRNEGISVLAVCPGPTQTELWPAGAKPRSAMQPRAVAEIALKRLGRSTSVVPGWKNSITTFATRLVPRSWNAAIYTRVVGGMLTGATTGKVDGDRPCR